MINNNPTTEFSSRNQDFSHQKSTLVQKEKSSEVTKEASLPKEQSEDIQSALASAEQTGSPQEVPAPVEQSQQDLQPETPSEAPPAEEAVVAELTQTELNLDDTLEYERKNLIDFIRSYISSNGTVPKTTLKFYRVRISIFKFVFFLKRKNS